MMDSRLGHKILDAFKIRREIIKVPDKTLVSNDIFISIIEIPDEPWVSVAVPLFVPT